MKSIFRLIAAIVISSLSGQVLAAGTFEKISVHGPSLDGNLAGDSAEREVFVYLPPGYQDSGRGYPVVYFLHGYAVGAQAYVDRVLNLPGSVD